MNCYSNGKTKNEEEEMKRMKLIIKKPGLYGCDNNSNPFQVFMPIE
jgi:hypothetical protein